MHATHTLGNGTGERVFKTKRFEKTDRGSMTDKKQGVASTTSQANLFGSVAKNELYNTAAL